LNVVPITDQDRERLALALCTNLVKLIDMLEQHEQALAAVRVELDNADTHREFEASAGALFVARESITHLARRMVWKYATPELRV
jgi:hypothetical protein